MNKNEKKNEKCGQQQQQQQQLSTKQEIVKSRKNSVFLRDSS